MFGQVVAQIYEDTYHLMTEIDVEAEQIYARVVRGWAAAQVGLGGLTTGTVQIHV